jgi:hypothetical protein
MQKICTIKQQHTPIEILLVETLPPQVTPHGSETSRYISADVPMQG